MNQKEIHGENDLILPAHLREKDFVFWQSRKWIVNKGDFLISPVNHIKRYYQNAVLCKSTINCFVFISILLLTLWQICEWNDPSDETIHWITQSQSNS